MSSAKSWRREVSLSRIAAAFFALALAMSVGYSASAQAYADDLVAGQGATLVAQSDGTVVNGGSAITENGTYTLAENATGTITIDQGLTVKLVGNGAANRLSGLNILVGSGSTLTIKDLYADQGASASTIDFQGDGKLILEGENLIDNDDGLNAAVIHVAKGNEVHFDGTGILYGYKSALCSYIGGNTGEANGKIVFDGGYWFLKGSKTGAVIGGDSGTDKGGDIVIAGGELYVKGVAMGALIGGSNEGKSGDVFVQGGLVELFEDFSGPAIGAGKSDNAGNVYVTGGSLKTTLSSNSANSYGQSDVFGGMPGVSWKAVKALNADDFALLTFDMSKYISDVSTDTVQVYLDSLTDPFYSGRAYAYVTNEAANPNEPTGTTKDNWLTNDEKWLVTQEDYGSTAYPYGKRNEGAGGSSLVPEKNLYFALSKQDHVLKVNDDTYVVTWDDTNKTFVTSAGADTSWYDATATTFEINTLSQMLGFAELVNAGTTFEDKTVTLGADLDLSAVSDWVPIGGKSEQKNANVTDQESLSAAIAAHGVIRDDQGAIYSGSHKDAAYSSERTYFYLEEGPAFSGTFDGQGYQISGLTITSADGGYRGLFGSNSGVIENVAISGSIGSESAAITSGADNIGGLVGYNNGEVSGVTGSVSVFVNTESIYAVGGIVGQNGPNGTISQCSNTANLVGSKATGGIVGRNYGVVDSCFNEGNVVGNQSRKDGIGGIVGYGGDQNSTYTNSITNCYNTGLISNPDGRWYGGIAGFADSATTVKNCYDVGQIDKGYSWNWNPVIGHVDEATPTAENNYSLEGLNAGDTTAATQPITIGIVKTEVELKSPEMVVLLNGGATVSGQALSAQADISAGAFNYDSVGINNGYPVLAWQGGLAITADDVSAANAAEQAIEAIGTVTVNSKDAIDAAQAKLIGLTDTQKALVSDEAKQALTDAKTAYDKAVADKAAADKAAADKAAADKAAADKAAADKAAADKAAQEAAAKKAADEAAAQAQAAIAAAAANAVTNGKVEAAGSGASAGTYKVLNAAANTVSYKAPASKNAKKVTVPATVKLSDGKTYKVTAIEAGAFKNMKKLTKVTIGKNVKTVKAKAFNNLPKLASVTVGAGVTKIASKAFQKTPKLKTITVKSKKLTKKSSVKGALSGSKVKQTVTVKAPKSKKKAYGKVFTKSNLKSPKKVTVK